MKATKLGICLLAAGGSRRLGSAKQLIRWKGRTLLEQAITTMQEFQASLDVESSAIVVLGAHHIQCAEVIAPTMPSIVNTEWEEGMASSLRCAIHATSQTACDTVLFWNCDQFLVQCRDLLELWQSYRNSSSSCAASAYASSFGSPAIFNQKYFDEIAALRGDHGARVVLKNHESELLLVHCEAAGIDIDTVEDIERFNQSTDDKLEIL